jgi:flagellar basal-body rod protein FlgB
MRTSLDSYLGIHAQALTLEAKRNEMLGANLANVDTPNYKARDLDFKAALSAAAGAGGTSGSSTLPLRAGNASQQAAAAASNNSVNDTSSVDSAAVKYRVPMAPALDGNTVDEQLEQSAFAENNVRYQATLTFLNNAIRGLMTAITGS